MMPELDWIMSSPCISPRKAQFHVWITFFVNMKIKLLWSFWILIFWSQIKIWTRYSFSEYAEVILSCYFSIIADQVLSWLYNTLDAQISWPGCITDAKQRAFWPWSSLLQKLLESVVEILNDAHQMVFPMSWCSFSSCVHKKFGHTPQSPTLVSQLVVLLKVCSMLKAWFYDCEKGCYFILIFLSSALL